MIERLNADFSQPAVVRMRDAAWLPSPMPGVARHMLDRVGGEVARATTIVRYAAGSKFSAHLHGGGEEFLVLDGVFEDASGVFPAGTYVRNPPGTSHAPSTGPGCLLFVKLHQMDPADRALLRIDTNIHPWIPRGEGVAVMALYQGPGERVELWELAAGAHIRLPNAAGLELLVLNGTLGDPRAALAQWDWLRLPAGQELERASSTGCRLWVKTGHLAPTPS